MAERKPSEESEWTARDKAFVVLIVAVLLGGGLLLTVGGIVVKASAAGKAERLRSSGVALTATLAEFKGSNKAGQANVELWYIHEGRQYHPRINCPREQDCDPSTQPTMGIRIDPAQPAEFVADNGVTDDSRIFFNSWKGMIIGVFLMLSGGLAAWVRRHTDRPVRRSR
ncbi:hypothetical protein ACQP2Y_41530 [Actinoplanes sp. CA-051413]|uniref:hypothetical protein n=1 Tax=Actinoplanes sp. CA-051413 TaxID=3239899 RepID=UPI003D97D711